MRKAAVALAFALALLAGIEARADAIYTYLGNPDDLHCRPTDLFPCDQAGSSDNDHGFISGYLELAAPIPANFDGIYEASNIVAFSFTNNYQTDLLTLISGFDSFAVTTDSHGAITSWYLGVGSTSSLVGPYIISEGGVGDAWRSPPGRGKAFGNSNPGTWTFNSGPGTVPEPASLFLFGSGLIAIGGAMRRRVRK